MLQNIRARKIKIRVLILGKLRPLALFLWCIRTLPSLFTLVTYCNVSVVQSIRTIFKKLSQEIAKVNTMEFRFSLSSTYKASVFSEISAAPRYFFHLKSFLSFLTVKVRKKCIDHILSYISFCFEIRAHLGHLFA